MQFYHSDLILLLCCSKSGLSTRWDSFKRWWYPSGRLHLRQWETVNWYLSTPYNSLLQLELPTCPAGHCEEGRSVILCGSNSRLCGTKLTRGTSSLKGFSALCDVTKVTYCSSANIKGAFLWGRPSLVFSLQFTRNNQTHFDWISELCCRFFHWKWHLHVFLLCVCVRALARKASAAVMQVWKRCYRLHSPQAIQSVFSLFTSAGSAPQ